MIGKFNSSFNGYHQHDSQELLAFLLDGLHEDLNRITEKPYFDNVSHSDENELAKLIWINHLKRNQSVIVVTLRGRRVRRQS